MIPSPFQQAIYDHVAAQNIGFINIANGLPQAHLIIKAVAGSGKTTTVVDTLKLTTEASIFLAFNKAIADELKRRVPNHVQARTFHSLCFNPVLRAIGAREVNQNKLQQLMRVMLSREDAEMYGAFVKKLVGLARSEGVGCLKPMSNEVFFALVEQHDLQLEHEDADLQAGIDFAKAVLIKSNESTEADFDDLLYFAVLKGIKLPQFSWVFVDEAQDTNAIQRAILKKILKPGGRLVAVGDPAQAIYGFRGADSNALDLIAEAFSPCISLPLSVTYRCATAIVEKAKQFVPEITARDGAPAGQVFGAGFLIEESATGPLPGWKLSQLGAHDLVVCRNTKPLLDLGYRMLRARIPVRIMGRDIGEGLISLIKKCDANRGDLELMLISLNSWKEREMQKAIAADNEAKAEAIEDRAGAIEMLAADMPEQERTVTALIVVIQSLFTNENSRTTLATIHKAKGLEAETVWWLCPSLCPSKWAKKDWQQQQERNLMYVAVTRAKSTLVLAEMGRKS